MVEKIFKIISNSKEGLTCEEIAQALLKQITLKGGKPAIFFAVAECQKKSGPLYRECTAIGK